MSKRGRNVVTTLAIAGMAIFAFTLAELPARAQTQCTVSGDASDWGFPATGYFEVPAGGCCLFALNVRGEILSAAIAQGPSNGTLNMVNVATYTYTPNPGFAGRDVFMIQASGKDQYGQSGTSMVTMNATVR